MSFPRLLERVLKVEPLKLNLFNDIPPCFFLKRITTLNVLQIRIIFEGQN